MPKDVFIQENHYYRNIARQLSHGRDLTAMLETIEHLISTLQTPPILSILHQIRDKIQDERKHYLSVDQQNISIIGKDLASHPLITTKLIWSPIYARNLLTGLTTSYRSARRCHILCRENPSVEHIHEWRKQAKHFRYQLMIILNTWPAVLKSWGSEIQGLTDLLGQANNLSVLANYIQTSIKAKDAHLTLEIMDSDRIRLIGKSQLLGHKLFAEKPNDFKSRIGIYLSQWEPLN